MKFTTPCFVRVEDVEKREELITWCASIGYTTNAWHLPPTVPYVFAQRDFAGRCGILALDSLPNDAVDCGDNIELFKALAAMNEENWWCQYVIDNYGNLGFGALLPGRMLVQLEGEYFDTDNYRKATAQEIIEYFNRKQK